MMKHASQRKLALLDANVRIPTRNPVKTIDVVKGQENQSKKRKVEHDDQEHPKRKGIERRHFHTSTPISKEIQSSRELSFHSEQWALTPAYFEEIIHTELKLEHRAKLSSQFCMNPKFVVTPNHREILLEWLIDVQLYLKVGNEVLHLAVIMMDLVLDSLSIEEGELQAVAAASIWIAYKFHCGGIKAKLILKLCKTVTQEKLLRYERKVLETVGMNLMFTNAMTVLHWHLYNVFGKEIPRLEYCASNYLLEIMLLHVDFVCETTSMRAAVAIYAALRLLKGKDDVEQRSGVTAGGRLMYRRLLGTLRMVRDKKSESFRAKSALYRKYSSAAYCCITTHPAMDPDNLNR